MLDQIVYTIVCAIVSLILYACSSDTTTRGGGVLRFSEAHRLGGSAPQPNHAFCVLLMMGDAYLPGAIATGASIANVKSAADSVCMCTPDVSESALEKLRAVYTHVVVIDYIEHKTRRLVSAKQRDYYDSWINRSFTKWRCLGLTQYSRVILLDADLILLKNCDELFDLPAPAACYSNPWARPFVANGMENPYITPGARDLDHGAIVSATTIMRAIARPTFVGGGFIVALEPSARALQDYIDFIQENETYGAQHKSISTSDEVSIAEFYARRGISWHNIHQNYAAIPWKKDWSGASPNQPIKAYHYFGMKPWETEPKYPDQQLWWDAYNSGLKKIELVS